MCVMIMIVQEELFTQVIQTQVNPG